MVERFKNYGLWVAVAGFAGLVLQTFGIDFAPEKYEELVNGFLTILVLAGILNNPSIGTGFKDEIK